MRYGRRIRASSTSTAGLFEQPNPFSNPSVHAHRRRSNANHDPPLPPTAVAAKSRSVSVRLPQTAIQLIAVHLAADEKDLLSFALADATFVEGVAHALDYSFDVDRTSQCSPLFRLVYPYVRRVHFVVDDRLGAAAALSEGYRMLGAPRLRQAEFVATEMSLAAVRGNVSLRAVSLHVFKAAVFSEVCATLASLPLLTSLAVTGYRDRTLVDVDRQFRCGCRYFRSSDAAHSSALAKACPDVDSFSLACECDANRTITIPSFSNLRHLAFSGRLDGLLRSHVNLLRLSAMHSLSLSLTHASDVSRAVRVLAPYVTDIRHAWGTSYLSVADTHEMLSFCPRLTSLDVVLAPGCECVLADAAEDNYLSRLRKLSLKVANRKELQTRQMFHEGYYKPHRSALTAIVRATECLEHLNLTDLCVAPDEFQHIVRHCGASLESLSVPLKSPDPNTDTLDLLCSFLHSIALYCTRLRKLDVSRPGSINLLCRQRNRRDVPVIINSDPTYRRVEVLLRQIARKLPGIRVDSVKHLMDPKNGTCKRGLRSASESFDFDSEASDTSEIDD